MDGAGRDEVAFARLHLIKIQQLGECAVLDGAFILLMRDIALEAYIKPRARLGRHHVPRLGLTVAVFMSKGIGIRGMHLYRKVLRRINELDEHGKTVKARGIRPPRLAGKDLGERPAVRDVRGTVRMEGKLPALRHGGEIRLLAVDLL